MPAQTTTHRKPVLEDTEIIKLIRNGDVNAFERIVERYHRHLLNFIYRILYNESIVEDIGQEVFISAYRSLDNFDAERGVPFSAWLFTIARNRCITMLRKRRNAEFVPFSETAETAAQTAASPEELLCSQERHEALKSALEQLPEPFRSTMMESLKGRSIDEIAEKCNIKAATVKTRLYRAREYLKLIIPFNKDHLL